MTFATVFYNEVDNPRKDEHISMFATSHKRYNLDNEIEDMKDIVESCTSWSGVLGVLMNRYKIVGYLPIYMYDHSGLRISTSDFCDGWDSGQIGWAFITKENYKKYVSDNEVCETRADSIINEEVKAYDRYVGNDSSWGYKIYDRFEGEDGELMEDGFESKIQAKKAMHKRLELMGIHGFTEED